MTTSRAIDLHRYAEQADNARHEILARTYDVFGVYGAIITPLGSVATRTTDILSDVDVWITVPDGMADEVIAERERLYGAVGRKLLTWERPRYAPKGGKHSVALYNTDHFELPIELDYFIASETHTRPFAPYLASGALERPDLPWASGDDDPARESTTNFCALVTLWAAKYMSRGKDEDENLAWVNKRFRQARAAFPDIPPTQTQPGAPASLEAILESLTASADPELAAAYRQIGKAVRISHLIKQSAT